MPPNDYPVYAPPLIVEVLSPSNSPAKLQRQRIVAMSAGTEEFWVVDAEKRTVQVTNSRGASTYSAGEHILLAVLFASLAVDKIFSV